MNFVVGHAFDGATGFKTGADLEELVKLAKFAVASGALDQITIEDDGEGKIRVKEASMLAKYLGNDVAGDGLTVDETTKALKVLLTTGGVVLGEDGSLGINTDGVTIELFNTEEEGYIRIKAGGISTSHIGDNQVTVGKMAKLATAKVLGNMSGAEADPSAVAVSNDPTLAGDSQVSLVTEHAVKGYVDAVPRTLQIVDTVVGTKVYNASSPVIPMDNTVPQSGEGIEVMTLKVTPKKIGSKLYIDATSMFSNNGNFSCSALFKDADANALATSMNYSGGNYTHTHKLFHVFTTTSLDEITFKVRVGGDGAVNMFNGRYDNVALCGGTLASCIVITEIG